MACICKYLAYYKQSVWRFLLRDINALLGLFPRLIWLCFPCWVVCFPAGIGDPALRLIPLPVDLFFGVVRPLRGKLNHPPAVFRCLGASLLGWVSLLGVPVCMGWVMGGLGGNPLSGNFQILDVFSPRGHTKPLG